ncbi:MAG: hypothetical protein K9N47_01760 [Prosthecobacter sp.]|uniref:hypothetical protein n=1 Tax=Prosthecobacter sp. TaxID=1965333 RepID=UPI0025E34EEA|nr:hypothetical protein [Prosthecobacter sp.]MCF7784814.1 hypothetical protein [Prosthecobacter sp.]
MVVTAWNRGQHLKTGGGYGFRFSSRDRDQYLNRAWRTVRFLVEEPDTWAEANIDKDCFWDDKTTLVNRSIGSWLLRKGYARWAKNEPPTFRLLPLGENRFRVVPEHLPDSLPCQRHLPQREWEEFQKAFFEGRLMEVRQEIRQRCQRLIEQLKEYFRDETTGLIECAACSWKKPGNHFRGDIVQMHHHQPVYEAPVDGRIIRWEDAVETFSPLCPTCHSLIHAKPNGGCYELDELRRLLAID